MVGPVSEAERASFARKLTVGVALLVGVSAGLTAVRVDASLPLTGGAVLAGLAVGWGLARFVVPAAESARERQRQRQRRARVEDSPFTESDLGDDADDEDGGDERPRTPRRRNS